MGEFYDDISENHAEWIKKQKVIFVGTAPLDPKGKVNLSPKGYDCFRIISSNQVCYLELTGSGIETQSHVEENNRITIMFCAFEGAPRIMRLFGTGTVHRVGSPEFNTLFNNHYTSDNCDIRDSTGKRSIIVVDVYKVGSSCGYGVPFYDYKGSRPTLTNYWGKKSEDQVVDYWVKKNTISLDGLPGMRHVKMGEKWVPTSKGGRKVTVVGGEEMESWWELGSVWANATLVAAGAGLGAAVASYVFKKRR
ncbi:hypothetical protein EC957_002180 [Mortierella hygrophila]|uniref:Pyridoxamine 5'-phosphate oxidase N-terminal domain-containing protein n=1 Tax=Mortierella hygrophila TaxID=979708 RepID=A0A9P6K1X3_9FUNG|nr:hypothetical protein EC957_002180 [Mortierella hygrophila]